MKRPLAHLLRLLPRAPLPAVFRAELATLVKEPPPGDQWLHEVKFDGYRIGCRIDRGKVRLLTRNGKDWTAQFPAIVEAARRLSVERALLDGEIAIVLEDGRTSFQALQNALGGRSPEGLVYFVFDLLHVDGRDASGAALEERKSLLRDLLVRSKSKERIRYSDHVIGQGGAVFGEACGKGLEGIVSKRRDRPYQPGRTDGWLKIKCTKRQEFVIVGFTDPEGSREGIGALLVAVHEGDRLVFAGKVGTGFTRQVARELRQRLERIEQPSCPLSERPPGGLGRNAHWVKPKLVAEVEFSEWTADGKLRHPSFQGLREDKRPAEVNREVAKSLPVAAEKRPRSAATASEGPRPEVAGIGISHPDRVMYPEVGVTKLELARYYESLAEWIVPHVRDRPLTLVRCPSGMAGECFYMKHSKLWAPPALRRVRIAEKTKVGEYLIADTPAALVSLVQMDVLEVHTWNSRFEHLEHPDRIVFDLDPGPDVKWPAVIAGARLVRQVLRTLRLESFVKTTGGVGLHVVVPLEPRWEWAECFRFSRAVAEAIVRLDGSRYTTAVPKAGRERKILIDYLRNNRANTSVAAYSTRAHPSASVSVPLAWSELSRSITSTHYDVKSLPKRLQRLRKDPWQRYFQLAQRLEQTMLDRLNEVG